MKMKILKKVSIISLFLFAFCGSTYSKLPTGLDGPLPIMPTPESRIDVSIFDEDWQRFLPDGASHRYSFEIYDDLGNLLYAVEDGWIYPDVAIESIDGLQLVIGETLHCYFSTDGYLDDYVEGYVDEGLSGGPFCLVIFFITIFEDDPEINLD